MLYIIILLPYILFANIFIQDIHKNNYISTKIVNKPFKITITSDTNMTGTICTTIVDYKDHNISKWHKYYFDKKTNFYNITFKINKATRFAQIKTIFINDKNISSCPYKGKIYYSDSFSIRPYKFIITSFPLIAYAGEKFPITFKALDYNNKPCKGYNEIKNTSFKIFTQINSNCKFGNLIVPVSFKDGIAHTYAIYDNVGLISLNITESHYEFAKIDKKDTISQERLIYPKKVYIKIYPYSFQSNTNFSTNNIYFMNKNLSNYANILTQIDAINKNKEIVNNFDKDCFAQNTNIKFSVNKHYLTNFIGMYNINNVDTNDSNFQRWQSTWNLSKNLFKNGTAFINIKFNIYKNYKIPIPIVVLNFRNLKVSSKYSKMSSNEIFFKNIKFYYLRLLTNDIYTDKNISIIPIYTLVYDKYPYIYTTGKQKLINWFTFNNIDKNKIKILGISENYQYNKKNINIKTELIENNKTIYLKILNKNKTHFVIHLDTPEYLWYSKFSPFNKKLHSYCTSHYCIEYNYKKINKLTKEVKKGKFKGVEKNSSQTKQIGIKIYR